MKQGITILIERGFTENQTNILNAKLLEIDLSLEIGRDAWMGDKILETDYTIHGITLSQIKSKFKMNYPAALLTMDWLIREPERAIDSINKGIR